MHAVFYQLTTDVIKRIRPYLSTNQLEIVALAQSWEFLGLYSQNTCADSDGNASNFCPDSDGTRKFDCLDILKNLFPNVALWVDYDLIPLDQSVGAVE